MVGEAKATAATCPELMSSAARSSVEKQLPVDWWSATTAPVVKLMVVVGISLRTIDRLGKGGGGGVLGLA
jgi:hypothetical protein